jgi:serralysin
MAADGFSNLSGTNDEPSALLLNADARGGSAGGKPSFTIDEAANRLTGGEAGWGGVLGAGATVTYAYRADAPSTMPDDLAGFSRFSAAQINQAEQALTAWSDVANIHFVRVGVGNAGEGAYSNQAAILFGDYSSGDDGAVAFGYYPGSSAADSRSGDVWVNNTFSYNANPSAANYGGMVLVHELGHAIGLAHPSDYDATADATITYSTDASYFEDSRQFTVMSYFSETNTGGYDGGRYASSPLLDDIAAAQKEYGANLSTRTGDTTYGFHSTADRPWFEAASASTKLVFAVWDAGGVDTFDFSGYSQDQVIDLRQGDFSSVGGLTGNVAVAVGAVIENALGGSGSDTISGNSAANNIDGGAGNDSISGGEGANFLRGGDGNDQITGGSGFDDINGNMGADTISGGSGGGDWLVGGKGDDRITGNGGDSILYGNIGNDTLIGGSGAELIRGGQDNDTLSGGAGNDWLSGDRGSDTISGGAGADIFHTFGDAGVDRVIDFNRAEGDRVQLDSGTTYTVAQVGADTVIDMTGGGQMILTNVQLASLDNGWIFAG